MTEAPPPSLIALAEAHGISAEHWSFFGERVTVPAATLRAVLAALGVRADTLEAIEQALVEAEHEPWRRLLPPSLISCPGERPILAHVRDGHDVELSVKLESGETLALSIPPQQPASREVDGVRVWRVETPLPPELPLGWHTLHARETRSGQITRGASTTLAIVPQRLPEPPARPGKGGRSWGLMAQLYSARSRASWGTGDLADLADLAAIAGARGADFVLLNPLHAGDVAPPIEPSPYLPTSRRFLSPLYARPEHILEFADLPDGAREAVLHARGSLTGSNTIAERLDRDRAWLAKRSALETIFAAGRGPARQAELDAFIARSGRPLADFGLWCALEEHYTDHPSRPPESFDLTSPLLNELRVSLAPRAEFFVWLQWVLDEQAERAQAAALASGMRIGVMHDLAVGVDPLGFDACVFREVYAHGLAVGAPPDMYNPHGQNWSQPPWNPRALAEAGYAPLRSMLRELLRHAGALRVDHVAGLFRLWCVPGGSAATQGAYLRYDHEAMLGVLALEAMRAGAVVIGEDLGTIEPWVREALAERGILGTSVLWFEREGDGLLSPERYRSEVLAAVTTHDLPPTAGYLAGEHIVLAERLGLLQQPLAEALAAAVRERELVTGLLRDLGLLDGEPSEPGEPRAIEPGEQQLVEALHRLIVRTPARLIGVSLADAVGEHRAQNVPGTHREYPNWQMPLAGPSGRAVLLDDLSSDERFRALTATVDQALR